MRNLRTEHLTVEPLFTVERFSATQLYDFVMVAHTTPHAELRDVVLHILKLASQPPLMIATAANAEHGE